MIFVNPTYLWGLLGLAVPLAIHLWNKKEGRTIKIGSVQLLTQANPKQASSLQLNEWFLLLLRVLLLTILVFILASPQTRKKIEPTPLVYLIEPSLFENKEIRAMVDSLPEESTYLLQKDFPKWTRDTGVKNEYKTPNYWQLSRETQSLHADSIVVFTRGLLQGIKGERPLINSAINWLVLNPETVKGQPAFTIQNKDSITLVSVNSNSNTLTYKKERISRNIIEISPNKDSISFTRDGQKFTVPNVLQDTIRVQIVAVDSLKSEKKYIEASFRSLAKYTNLPIEITEIGDSPNAKNGILVWLKNDKIPDFKGKVITYKRDKFAEKLLVGTINPLVFELTGRLNPENVISKKLPEQLLFFMDLYPNIETYTQLYDNRSIAKNEMQPRSSHSEKKENYAQTIDLSPWFWLGFILLFILERTTSFYRKQ